MQFTRVNSNPDETNGLLGVIDKVGLRARSFLSGRIFRWWQENSAKSWRHRVRWVTETGLKIRDVGEPMSLAEAILRFWSCMHSAQCTHL